MIYAAVGLFAVAAIFGVLNFKDVMAKKEIPRWIVYSHGLCAATGLVLLIVYAVQSPAHYPMVSIILFATAALGGFYMFFRDMSKKEIPISIASIHALLAVAGFVMLLLFAFAGNSTT